MLFFFVTCIEGLACFTHRDAMSQLTDCMEIVTVSLVLPQFGEDASILTILFKWVETTTELLIYKLPWQPDAICRGWLCRITRHHASQYMATSAGTRWKVVMFVVGFNKRHPFMRRRWQWRRHHFKTLLDVVVIVVVVSISLFHSISLIWRVQNHSGCSRFPCNHFRDC